MSCIKLKVSREKYSVFFSFSTSKEWKCISAACVLLSVTWRCVIWKVPFSIRLIRPLFPRILWPSFSHWMLGVGFPMMWQCSWVVVPGASVWLAGPWRMMGGTRSEGAERDRKQTVQQLHIGMIRSGCGAMKDEAAVFVPQWVVKKTNSKLGCTLDTVQGEADRRKSTKLAFIINNTCCPLLHTVEAPLT